MGVVVEVSARKFSIPDECACCGGETELQVAASYTRTTGKRVVHSTTRSLNFPYCVRCDSHIKRWQSAGTVLGVFVVLGGTAAVVVGEESTRDTGTAVFIGSIILAFILFSRTRRQARAMCCASCAGPQVSVDNLGWSGSVSSFAFESRTYAVKFALANRTHLINVSMRLRGLIEEYTPTPRVEVVARRSPPPAVLVARTPPPHARPAQGELVLEWIARIEGFKGDEARRNAVKRALDEVVDPSGRRDLMIAVGRIHVAAVLDKVDGLASAAAKKRHLRKAIADLRAYDIPDGLQNEQLAQLEERLEALA